jgi:hypothetical protein
MMVLAAVVTVSWACTPPPIPDFPRLEVLPPDPAAVDGVIFLIGDAGAVESGRSPILADLAARIEHWSGAIARDSAVTVAFLGDVVYPVGVRDRGTPGFSADSLHLWSQIELLAGPEARRRGSLGLFLVGNHDWGNMTGEAGVRRLLNLDEQLAIGRAQGLRVRLIPEAGTPGPGVVDLRHNTRVIALDTHWFLQERSQRERDVFLVDFLDAVSTAPDRHLVILAHHPFSSAGEHGSLAPVAGVLGLKYLLKKSGTLIQDLNSPKYRDLIARLRTAFTAAERQPLVFAGGHDHSIQVLEAEPDREFDPRYQLVSGAGSKRTPFQDAEGLRWGARNIGYMILFLLRDEAVQLFVVTSDSDVLLCPAEPGDERVSCLATERDNFRPQYSSMLSPPRSLPDTTRTGSPPDSDGGSP